MFAFYRVFIRSPARIGAFLHDGQTPKTRRLFCPTSPATFRKNISLSESRNIVDLTVTSRAHYGGRIAIVTTRGAGCDGRGRAARRAAQSRTVKPCGPDSPMLGSTPGQEPGGWWLRSPAHQGERGAAVKPLRRECRVFRPYLTTCVHSTPFSTQGCGCGVRPALPAPSVFRGDVQDAKLGHSVPRE